MRGRLLGWVALWLGCEACTSCETGHTAPQWIGSANKARPRGQHGVIPPRRPAAPEGAPDVVVVVWHAARFDRTTLADPALPTTPFLASLAADGTAYTRALTAAPWALPATASLLTGLPPSLHGVEAAGDRLDDRFATLPEVMAAHGWDTFAWTGNPHINPESNVLQGMQTVHAPWLPPWRPQAEAQVTARTGVEVLPDGRRKDARWALKDTGALGITALSAWWEAREEPERPVFALVDLGEAQAPRMPSAEAFTQVLGGQAPSTALAQVDDAAIHLSWILDTPPTKAEAEAARTRYDAVLAHLDALTRDLVASLPEARRDHTLVIVVGDHGELLGEDGLWGHPFSLRPAITQVPFVVHWPGTLDAGRDDRPVSTARLTPMVLTLTGLPLPARVDPTSDTGPWSHGVVTEHGIPFPAMPMALRRKAPDADLSVLTRPPKAVLTQGAHSLLVDGDGVPHLFQAAPWKPSQDPEALQDMTARWTAWQASLGVAPTAP